MKALFLSPPATSYIEPRVEYERTLEVALPRIPFEVLAHLDNSIETEIVDLDWELDKYPNRDYQQIISEKIRQAEPDIVLTTIFAQSVTDSIDQITTAVKQENQNIPVVVGGQAVAHMRERIFRFCPNVDAACLDARSLNQIAYGLGRERLPKRIFNGYHSSRWLPSFYPQQLYRNFPIKSFVNFYQTPGVKVYAYLENERGCPFHCTFCAVPRFVQEREVEATIAEAEFLLRNGISAFYLTDLTFGLNRRKAKELLEGFRNLRRNHSEFHFRCITRVDFIDYEMGELLKSAGCYEIGFGVETTSTEVLTSIRKGTTREQNLEAISIATKAGLAVRLFLMIGLPGEDIRDLFRFLHEVNGITKNILLQISLARPIVGPAFQGRITSGKLKRGNMHQLDFRTDGRQYGLDRTENIVNFILLALAWPSTEISLKGNRKLQDLLLLEGGVQIHAGVESQGGIARRDDIILMDTGNEKLMYVPRGVSVKIRQCLMECSDDFFEFLVLANGRRNLEDIKDELLRRFISKPYYKTKAWASRRTGEIFSSLLDAGLIQAKERR